MKANESLQNDQSTATEDALRRAVDTTPAFIHTARPNGYLDYFNRGWLDFLGKSFEEVCGWRWTESVHPEDVAVLVQKWLIIYLLGGAHIFRNRHRFFDRDPNVDNDIPAVRKVRIEVVAIPWLVVTTLILILLISFWLA
jgi:PAS domain S-box-containing protein